MTEGDGSNLEVGGEDHDKCPNPADYPPVIGFQPLFSRLFLG